MAHFTFYNDGSVKRRTRNPHEGSVEAPEQPSELHRWDDGEWVKDIQPATWMEWIADERERRLDASITVTLSDGDYTIPVSDRSLSLAPEAGRRARAKRETRPFPTDKGTVELGPDDLDTIAEALDKYVTGVWRRAGELERMVAKGTITEKELATGWPKASS